MTGGQGVDIDIEDIAAIGTGTMPALRDQAHRRTQPIRDNQPAPDAFGPLPAGRDFATLEAAATAIFEATVAGVKADLATFGENLVRAAETHRGNEEGVSQALTSLNSTYVEQGADQWSSSSQRFDEAKTEQAQQEGVADAVDRVQAEVPLGTTTESFDGPVDPPPADPGTDGTADSEPPGWAP